MKISITDIENEENKVKNIEYSEIIEEFNKEKPIIANLKATMIGDLIQLSGQINATLVLTCDMCLKEYTQDFKINVDEFFTKFKLNEEYSNEFELKQDGFIQDLDGNNEIDITDFVYQSVILNIPNKLVCDINCKGDDSLNKYMKTETIDPRLEIFKNIKIEKDK